MDMREPDGPSEGTVEACNSNDGYKERACYDSSASSADVSLIEGDSRESRSSSKAIISTTSANRSSKYRDGACIASATTQVDRWLAQFRRRPPEILSERDLRIVCSRVSELWSAMNRKPSFLLS